MQNIEIVCRILYPFQNVPSFFIENLFIFSTTKIYSIIKKEITCDMIKYFSYYNKLIAR